MKKLLPAICPRKGIFANQYWVNNGTASAINKNSMYEVFNTSLIDGDYDLLGRNGDTSNNVADIVEKDKMVHVLEIKAVDFITLIAKFSKECDTDELRPVMGSINFDATNNVLCASDCMNLITEKIAPFISKSIMLQGNSELTTLKQLVKHFKTETLIVKANDSTISIGCNEFALYVNNVQGNYPNYISTIPREVKKFIQLTPETIAEIYATCKTFKQLSKGSNPNLLFKDGVATLLDEVNERSQDFNYTVFELDGSVDAENCYLLMPICMSVEHSNEIVLNAARLLRSGKTIIGYNDSEHAVVLR